MNDRSSLPATDYVSNGAAVELVGQSGPVAAELPPRSRLDPRRAGARARAAVSRYRRLVAAFGILGAIGAYVVWHTHEPAYAGEGAIWIEPIAEGGSALGAAPSSRAWVDLLRSWSVLDTVVVDNELFVVPQDGAPRTAFSGLRISEPYRTGTYILSVTGNRTVRLHRQDGELIDSSQAGSPLGAALGFAWQPDTPDLRPGMVFTFEIMTPRDAAQALNRRINTRLAERGSMLTVELLGKDPTQVANVVNGVLDRTVSLAAALKRIQLVERAQILGDQLTEAEIELATAESELANFRSANATLPSDRGFAREAARDPLFLRYFELRDETDAVSSDRSRLEGVLEEMGQSDVRLEALEGIESVRQSSELTAAIQELAEARADWRRMTMTGSPEAARTLERIESLEETTIPSLAGKVVEELTAREAQSRRAAAAASSQLRAMPARTIEEARLSRRAESAATHHANVRQRYDEARLAAVSSVPDVRILDRASPPQVPVSGRVVRVMLSVLAGPLLLGVVAAILMDRADPKVRRKHDVARDLQLDVLGQVPSLRLDADGPNPEAVLRMQEAFRELRLNLAYAKGNPSQICVTITSPEPGDGKSLVATNLAMAFAETGRRVALIDADTRRGALHSALGLPRRPGLTDVLTNEVELDEAIHSGLHDNLDVITSGTRVESSPQLLGSSEMQQLLADARANYDVVIVDTPPLTVGSDGLTVAALTGALVLVLRSGATDRQMAAAKLAVIRRLPVTLVGAILNDLPDGEDPRAFAVAQDAPDPDYVEFAES